LGRLKHLLLLSFLTINSPVILAQLKLEETKKIPVSTNETVYIHTNALTFVSGEMLLYKLYCLNPSDNTTSSISKIAYVELVGTDKENVFHHKLFLENGTAQGDFFIPGTLKTGNYKLVGYTNWMLNKTNAKSFESDIFIINPYQSIAGNNPDASDSVGAIPETNAQPVHNSQADFSLDLNRKTYATREKVEFRVKTLLPNAKGHYSLSVRKISDLPEKTLQTAQTFANSEPTSTMAENAILPELRGEMISGTIVSKNTASKVGNVTVALSVPGKSFGFKSVKTNASGKFIFNLDKAYYTPDIIIQVMDERRNDYTVSIDKPIDYDHSQLAFPSDINLKKNLKNAITERAIASQVENAYYGKKTDSITKENVNALFFDPLAKDYILDDFTRFPKLEETIVEIVKEMSFTKNDGKYAIHLRDIYAQVHTSEPSLVLVDGLLIQDINELFDYDTRNFYKVTIVPGGYYYGSNYFDGIVNFVTKNNDFVSKSKGDYMIKADVLRPLNKKTYYNQDYSDKSKYERIPDYRYQLLWQPELTLSDAENGISFFTSDVSGKFEIVLEGFTEKGIPVSLSDVIEVK